MTKKTQVNCTKRYFLKYDTNYNIEISQSKVYIAYAFFFVSAEKMKKQVKEGYLLRYKSKYFSVVMCYYIAIDYLTLLDT